MKTRLNPLRSSSDQLDLPKFNLADSNGLTRISHGGHPPGSGAAFPGAEAEGIPLQTDPLSSWLPAGELLDDCSPGPAAVPGVRPGYGGSRHPHGHSASMTNNQMK